MQMLCKMITRPVTDCTSLEKDTNTGHEIEKSAWDLYFNCKGCLGHWIVGRDEVKGQAPHLQHLQEH